MCLFLARNRSTPQTPAIQIAWYHLTMLKTRRDQADMNLGVPDFTMLRTTIHDTRVSASSEQGIERSNTRSQPLATICHDHDILDADSCGDEVLMSDSCSIHQTRNKCLALSEQFFALPYFSRNGQPRRFTVSISVSTISFALAFSSSTSQLHPHSAPAHPTPPPAPPPASAPLHPPRPPHGSSSSSSKEAEPFYTTWPHTRSFSVSTADYDTSKPSLPPPPSRRAQPTHAPCMLAARKNRTARRRATIPLIAAAAALYVGPRERRHVRRSAVAPPASCSNARLSGPSTRSWQHRARAWFPVSACEQFRPRWSG
ncbi:hypothetical protein BJ546DRAFT_598632 [Cryomyces antarcticus]